jgi:hypothetical protein
MFSSVRRVAGGAAVATIAAGAVLVLAPGAASAASTIQRPTSYVFTGPSALSQCQALGQQEVATNGWDGYSCKSDPTVSSDAIRLWVIIWVGCPTC